MGLERHVLGALGLEGGVVGDVGFRQSGGEVAYAAIQLRPHVLARALGEGVQIGGVGMQRLVRREHCAQDLVIDTQRPAAGFGRGLGLRDHRGHALADIAHDIVEYPQIGRIVSEMLVLGAGVAGEWRVEGA